MEHISSPYCQKDIAEQHKEIRLRCEAKPLTNLKEALEGGRAAIPEDLSCKRQDVFLKAPVNSQEFKVMDPDSTCWNWKFLK